MPEGFTIDPEGLVVNETAYPAELISHGPDAKNRVDRTVMGASLAYTMELDYHSLSYGLQDEVWNRLQNVGYKWELIDISNVKLGDLMRVQREELLEKTKEERGKEGQSTSSGIARDIARDVSNAVDDAHADLEDWASDPVLGPSLGSIAASTLWDIGAAVVDAFFTLASQPLNDRKIAFKDEGTFLLRCFAHPVVTKEMAEEVRARGRQPVIRAPSVAYRLVRVQPINQRAEEEADAEQKAIDALRAKLDKPGYGYTREDRQRDLDEALRARDEDTPQAIERQLKYIRGQLTNLDAWHQADEQRRPVEQRDPLLWLWWHNLTEQGIELGPYEQDLRDALPQLEAMQKRALGFGSEGLRTPTFRPRMKLASEITGGVLDLITTLGEATYSRPGYRVWKLLDVTTAGTQDHYEGVGRTHTEAIRDAFYRFRDDSEYGRGCSPSGCPPSSCASTRARRSRSAATC